MRVDTLPCGIMAKEVEPGVWQASGELDCLEDCPNKEACIVKFEYVY